MHTIVRDIVATVTGPGFDYKTARVLFDTDGNAAVFIPPGTSPAVVFASSPSANQMQGRSVDGTVFWKRKSASCSFPLAKCHTKTSILAVRWPDEVPVGPPMNDTTSLEDAERAAFESEFGLPPGTRVDA